MAKSNSTSDAAEPEVPANAEAVAEESGFRDSGDENTSSGAVVSWFPGLPAYTSTPDAEHEWQLEHNPSYQGQLAPKTKGIGKK